MSAHPAWILLVISLPSSSATTRMRIWRALKMLGAAALRDGVYLAPATAGMPDAFEKLGSEIAKEGGSASLLNVQSRSEQDEAGYRALFDRSADYDGFTHAIAEARSAIASSSVPELNRMLRRMRRDYEALQAIDFFPNEASKIAGLAWADLVNAAEQAISPGEPHSSDSVVMRRHIEDYQGLQWATRRRIWVDRVASAWLIRRFIDPGARFTWLEAPAQCPGNAIGFDYDGAEFTHVGKLVTFEVLVRSFGLDGDPGLSGLGTMVHALDIGEGVVPEAKGFEAVLAGARQRMSDDDTLLAEIAPVLDSLHAYFSSQSN
jgi:hypothetical protein